MNRIQASLIGALLTLGIGASAQPQAPAQGPKQNMPPASGAQVLPDFADLVERYGPAVVNINTRTRGPRGGSAQVPGLSEDDPFYEFFRRFMPDGQVPKGGPPGRRGESPRGERNTLGVDALA